MEVIRYLIELIVSFMFWIAIPVASTLLGREVLDRIRKPTKQHV